MNSKDKMPWVPPAGLFRMIKGMRGFFRKLDIAFMPPSVAVFEKAQQIWIAKAIGVACELNLADILRNRP
ncbi:MAG: hypothetical protein FJY07_06385, partial [Bacteroidetes bacterium]|nr:hypothetical protein [Bacteroidota bacterium]